MMQVVTKSLADLHEAPKNVRKHTDKQIKEYVRSLEMFGQIKPIVIDEHGEIIAGNGLFLALRAMERETCECYIVSGLTSAQKKKLMLADNRVYELGITDVGAFEEIILDLDGDIDVPGWDEDLLSMMNATAADVDDAVLDYGDFEESAITRLSDKKPPAPAREDSIAYQPEEPPTPARAAEHINTYHEPETLTSGAPEALQRRYIICPKCGEKICL
jgi:hypothetical protein